MPTISGLSDKIPVTYAPTQAQRHRAARSAAHHATDAAELAVLLDMLGLDAADGLTAPEAAA